MLNIIIDRVEATVRALFIKRKRGGQSVPLQSVEVINSGLDGDHHTGYSRRRQILLMSGSVLDALQLEPGSIYENVVVDGLDVMALKEGQQLQLGNVLVSVTMPCEPCIQMDRIRPGLRETLENRRGMFVKVEVPGIVHVGDAVVLCEQ
jgi:MOSC domain-containing protein YiiM